jgi:hypothetical protein
MYRVAWRSLVTGLTGAGECFSIDFSQLQRYVDHLNNRLPEVFHWIEQCVG